MSVTNGELVHEVLRPMAKTLSDHNVTAERIAEKLDGDLDYKEAIFVKKDGKSKKIVEVEVETPAAKRVQQTALKMAVDMLGLNAPDKHVFPGPDGLPQDISGSSRLEEATKILALAMERKKAAEEDE